MKTVAVWTPKSRKMGKIKKCPYLRKKGKIDKTKGTLFSQTLRK